MEKILAVLDQYKHVMQHVFSYNILKILQTSLDLFDKFQK